MQVKSVKTYAWSIAIANSRPIKINNKLNGIICKNDNIPPDNSIVHANPAIIFKRVWPEVILANNRIANVKTLTM